MSRTRHAIVALVLAGALWGAAAPALAAAKATACRATVQRGVLPAWARTGFSEARPRMPHVLSAAGRLTAILWADPLLSPPAETHNNKILWVARATTDPGSDLRISAQRMRGAQAVGPPVSRRVMGGPGPSIINLPAAGCWRLTLRWSGLVDSIDLRYAPN